ncbi:MAG: hypothetical protein BMS9Abin06_0005 [Gammaproteobacteria bacterium]|nr:MAG: hypothetical protein BMS9Abin06_0005 [Gammaproteobacteria bacterium]
MQLRIMKDLTANLPGVGICYMSIFSSNISLFHTDK